MVATVAPVAALLFSVALLLMGNGLQGTLLPMRASLEAFGALDIGVLGSSYFLGFAAGCFYGPKVVAGVGHIRTFTAMVAVASCVVLGHALAVSPLVWWLLRAITGFCFAVLFMVIESWLNERATNETRGFIFAIYTIINLTVITLGQLMLILDEPSEFPLFALASILVSLAAVPVALTRSKAPTPIAGVKVRIRHLYRRSPVGVIGCAGFGMVIGSFWGLGPIFAQGEDASVLGVALFMSVVVIAGAVGQWPFGWLSDRTDRRKVIVLSCLGAALAGIGMVVVSQLWQDGILIAAFVFGMFAFPLYALSVAHLNDFVEPEGYVEAASGLLLVYALGAVAGPFIASVCVRLFGIESLFAFTALVHVTTAAFAVFRMLKRAPTAEEEHISFADALWVSQTVSSVDPLSTTEAQADEAERPEE